MNSAAGGLATNATLPSNGASGPGLFVSNAPEQIGLGGGGFWQFGDGPARNLCKVSLTGTNVPTRVRVFLWHISRFETASFFGILVSTPNSDGQLSNLRVEVRSEQTGNLSPAGMCLAASHLFGTLDAANFANGQNTLDVESEALVWSAEVPAGTQNPAQFRLLGAILEFDVAGATALTIRSVASLTNGSWGAFADDVTPPGNNFGSGATHVRGYWRHANLSLDLPGDFDANPLNPPPAFTEYDFCEAGGPEATYYSGANSLTGDDLPNPGAYGVNRRYTGVCKNTNTTTAGKLYLGIRARNTGAAYFGAGQVLLPTPLTTRRWPPIRSTLDPRAYHLTVDHTNGFFSVSPNETSLNYSVQMATGAGAGTPANLIVAREPIWTAPVEDPA